MSQELLIGFLPPLGWVCWWLGGRGWPPFGKGWRRYIFPSLVAVSAIIAGMSWWPTVVGCAGMVVAHSSGYGETSAWWKRTLTIFALGFCVCLFGAAWWWGVIISGWFALSYLMSRKVHAYTWAWTESGTGLLQGIALVTAFSP